MCAVLSTSPNDRLEGLAACPLHLCMAWESHGSHGCKEALGTELSLQLLRGGLPDDRNRKGDLE